MYPVYLNTHRCTWFANVGVPAGLAGELAVSVLAVLPRAAPAARRLLPGARVPVLARPPGQAPGGPGGPSLVQVCTHVL